MNVCLTVGLCLALPPFAWSQSALLDFDNATPVIPMGQSIPFAQTSGGITANFSSPAGPAYSIQADATTRQRLSKFSGRYLYANYATKSTLQIRFNRSLQAISFTFGTVDYEIEVPSNLQLTAYLDSTVVGSATTHGTYSTDSMPMGTLSFDSGGKPFNYVEILLPFQNRGATVFTVDNIAVTGFSTFSSVSAASYTRASPVAPGSIASGFGSALCAREEWAASVPLPTTLADASVTLTDAAGVSRPAPLFYAGPLQINWLVPEGTPAGLATVRVTRAGQETGSGMVSVEALAPGIFTANQDGKGAPAATAVSVAPGGANTAQAVARCGPAAGSCVPEPIALGPSGTTVVLVLYGTGIRGRQSAVTAAVGGVNANVEYAGPQGQFVGLDQVNVVIPRELAGRGELDVVLTVDGKAANTVRINIQ